MQVDTSTISFAPLPNPWARISEIARKLHVPPRAAGSPATITALGADGNYYDIFDVVAAALDTLSRTPPPYPTQEAYEAACAALHHWRDEAKRLGKIAGVTPREMNEKD